MARVDGVLVVVVVVMMMAGAVLAAVPGPRNLRYPDYIVYPGAMCVEEGSFLHPNNCSWYYRCVDRMSIGYYYTYYFECEPGTVFDDDLDQCVFPFYITPPCGTAGTNGTAGVTGQPGTTDGPTGSTPTFSSTAVTGVTPDTTPSGVSTLPGSEFPCEFKDDTCDDYQICSPNPMTNSLCTGCYIGSFLIDIGLLCSGTNTLYDREMKQCVPKPTDEQLCTTAGSIDLPTVALNYTKQITCALSDLTPFADWIKKDYCKDYILCDPPGTYKGKRSLCDNYYLCVLESDNTWSTTLESCPEGQVFDYDSQNKGCVDIPTKLC